MRRRVLLLLACLLVLVSCGKLPRPFERDSEASPNPLAVNIFLDAVDVRPVEGTTLPMGQMLADSVVASLEKTYEIPAATSGLDRSRFVLKGWARRNIGPEATAQHAIDWVLEERGKGDVARFTQDIPFNALEWDYGDARIFDLVRDETGTEVAKLVLGDRFGAQGRDRYLGRRGVFLGEIRGAPGDGNAALRRAMSVALAGAGVRLNNDPDKSAFTLGADIDVGPPDEGVQAVSIIWQVEDIAGQILGKAGQSNAVPTGSLDGQWGRTAAFVAAAAVEGVVRIIDENDPSKLRAPDLGSGPPKPRAKPKTAPLPTYPGRAPPPPR